MKIGIRQRLIEIRMCFDEQNKPKDFEDYCKIKGYLDYIFKNYEKMGILK